MQVIHLKSLGINSECSKWIIDSFEGSWSIKTDPKSSHTEIYVRLDSDAAMFRLRWPELVKRIEEFKS